MVTRMSVVVEDDYQEFVLTVPAGESIFEGVKIALEAANIEYAQLTLLSGPLATAIYHTAPPELTGRYLVAYGAGVDLGAAQLLTANGTYGKNRHGEPLLHCHGVLRESAGGLHGGHLAVHACTVGETPLRVRGIATRSSGFVAGFDLTSNMDVLQPVRLRKGSHVR